MPTPDLALAVRKITREGSTRIAESAFKLALQRRKKVTSVHKANVLRVSDGLYLECARAVAARYPQVQYEERIIDASQFDVVVTTNMYGDILSDEASEIAGSLGLAASLNAGADHGVAQAQHGSAPDIAGKNIANPSSFIGSAAMLLAWLGERRGDKKLNDAALAIDGALDCVIANKALRTPDMGGQFGPMPSAPASRRRWNDGWAKLPLRLATNLHLLVRNEDTAMADPLDDFIAAAARA